MTLLSDEEMKVEKMVKDAVAVIRAMPIRNTRPAEYRSNMPDPIRTFWEAYNMEPDRWTKTRPGSQQIDLADRMLDWIAQVDGPRRRKLIWMRAGRRSWRQCGKELGWSHEWARRQYQEAMRQLTEIVRTDPNAERAWRQSKW